jgi:outer membrane protein OmpA-like peptidoglycan-associated protein
MRNLIGQRKLIGMTSAAAVLVVMLGWQAAAGAHDADPLCGGVIDSDGDSVIETDGDDVSSSSSHPCEPEVAVVEPVAVVATEPVVAEPLTVYFGISEDELDAEAAGDVQAFADDLMAGSPSGVTVVGHTDTSGSDELNQQLAEARAANVAEALIAAGVPADLIDTGSTGEQDLAVTTSDGTREAENRRVVVTPAY